MTRCNALLFAAAVLVTSPLPPSPAAAQLPYAESFDGSDGSPWPAPWTTMSFYLLQSDLQGDRGRMSGQAANGSGAVVARMLLPGFSETDVEAVMTLEFENAPVQGIGFYARQNGGTLQEYVPFGQGYALFLKGGWGWPEDLGIWRELNGQEVQIATGYNPVPGGLQSGVRYAVRFRVTQHAPDSTLIQAKVWIEADVEPVTWTVETFDTTPALQGTPGSFALDVYNFQGTAHVFVDELMITNYPPTVSAPHGPPPAGLRLSVPAPNPVSRSARLFVTVPEAGTASLELFDAAGRRVGEAYRGHLPAGSTVLPWTPLDAAGGPPPPGIYFLRLSAGRESAVQRIVVVR